MHTGSAVCWAWERTAGKRARFMGWLAWVCLVSMALATTAAALDAPPQHWANWQKEAYWFDQGGLYAVYGNQRAAIASFAKVIALNPRNAAAHFNQGIAYAEAGDADKALEAINNALALDPRNGRFHFGRGRVYLLYGDQERAWQDFSTGAELGDADARRYLQVYACAP